MIWRGNRRMPAVLAAAQLTCRRVVTAGRTATRLTTTRHLAHAQRRSMDSTSDPLSEALREAVADTTPVVMPARVRDARRQASMLRASSVGAPTTLQSTAAASSVAAGSATRDSIDQIEEILGGYDEQALSAVVDKTQFLCFSNLLHWRAIQRLLPAQLHALLDVARVPAANRPVATADLRRCVRNTMLVMLDHMGTSELQRLAERVSWRNASSTIDHQRDMLRVWIQQPECTLFTRPPFHEQLNAYHLQHRRELAVHMRFHHASLIRTFDRGRLTALLRQHYLSVEGSHGQLAERLIAFQEFVLYAVFNGRDARQYLRNHFWLSRLDRTYLPELRRRCILHLRHPHLTRYVPRYDAVPESELSYGNMVNNSVRTSASLKPTWESADVVADAPTYGYGKTSWQDPAVLVASSSADPATIVHDPATEYKYILGAYEEVMSIRKNIAQFRHELAEEAPYDPLATMRTDNGNSGVGTSNPLDFLLENEKARLLDKYLVPEVRVNRDRLLASAPVFLHYDHEPLWTLERDFAYQQSRFDFWKVVSTVLKVRYGVQRVPSTIKRAVEFQQTYRVFGAGAKGSSIGAAAMAAAPLSSDAAASLIKSNVQGRGRVLTNAQASAGPPLHSVRFFTAYEMEMMTPVDLRRALEERKLDGLGGRRELLFRLATYQEDLIKGCASADELRRFLRASFTKVPQTSSGRLYSLRRRCINVLRYSIHEKTVAECRFRDVVPWTEDERQTLECAMQEAREWLDRRHGLDVDPVTLEFKNWEEMTRRVGTLHDHHVEEGQVAGGESLVPEMTKTTAEATPAPAPQPYALVNQTLPDAWQLVSAILNTKYNLPRSKIQCKSVWSSMNAAYGNLAAKQHRARPSLWERYAPFVDRLEVDRACTSILDIRRRFEAVPLYSAVAVGRMPDQMLERLLSERMLKPVPGDREANVRQLVDFQHAFVGGFALRKDLNLYTTGLLWSMPNKGKDVNVLGVEAHVNDDLDTDNLLGQDHVRQNMRTLLTTWMTTPRTDRFVQTTRTTSFHRFMETGAYGQLERAALHVLRSEESLPASRTFAVSEVSLADVSGGDQSFWRRFAHCLRQRHRIAVTPKDLRDIWSIYMDHGRDVSATRRAVREMIMPDRNDQDSSARRVEAERRSFDKMAARASRRRARQQKLHGEFDLFG